MKAYHESSAHQRAKAQIAAACARAGYAVTVEAAGEDWRADVLAVRGTVSLAFEVQWSPLKLHEALDRQARYARDGVRGCWFFRAPPTTRAVPDLALARHDLPLFHLLANADESFSIALDGRLLALDDLTARLVSGRVRFCPEAALTREVELAIALYGLMCPACARPLLLPRVSGRVTARCGAILPIDSATGAALADAAAMHLHDEGSLVCAGACPMCSTPIDERTLWLAHYAVHPQATVTHRVLIAAPIRAPYAHWCAPDDGVWCG